MAIRPRLCRCYRRGVLAEIINTTRPRKRGLDASQYDVNDIGSMEKMSEETGWTVKECHKIIDNLALGTKKEPVKKVLSSITVNLNDLVIE